jgi:hypothetical protein
MGGSLARITIPFLSSWVIVIPKDFQFLLNSMVWSYASDAEHSKQIVRQEGLMSRIRLRIPLGVADVLELVALDILELFVVSLRPLRLGDLLRILGTHGRRGSGNWTREAKHFAFAGGGLLFRGHRV